MGALFNPTLSPLSPFAPKRGCPILSKTHKKGQPWMGSHFPTCSWALLLAEIWTLDFFSSSWWPGCGGQRTSPVNCPCLARLKSPQQLGTSSDTSPGITFLLLPLPRVPERGESWMGAKSGSKRQKIHQDAGGLVCLLRAGILSCSSLENLSLRLFVCLFFNPLQKHFGYVNNKGR